MILLIGAAFAVEPLQADWPLPIKDVHVRGMFLADQLEYRFPDAPGTLATDIEGWVGGDIERIRYRAEGSFGLGDRTGEGQLGVAYGRLLTPWIELQIGAGVEAQNEVDAGVETRLEVGIEMVVPYDFDVEALLRVSHRGRVSTRVTAIKELLFTQRLVLQLRAEVTAASKASLSLDRPWGLENVEAGVRLRYELKREFAPYLGATWSGGYGGPSKRFGFTHGVTAVGGVRVWY